MKKRILYIDDDPDALELYQNILENDFELTTKSDYKEALQLLKKNYFDLILLDIYFPGASGFDLFSDIRKIPLHFQTPIIFISSDDALDIKTRALELGSEDFISRHTDPDEVKILVKARLKSSETKKQKTSFIVGDIFLDSFHLIVKKENQLIELTQIEYKILLFLLRSYLTVGESPQSIDSIIDFTWQAKGENVLPRTLNTHITNLRKKLGSNQIQFISTRGEGFHIRVK